jgi:hypothetical protein
MAAITGAIDTAWCEPRGSLTGNADVIRVRTVQNATPSRISKSEPDGSDKPMWRAMEGSAGNTRVAATSATALRTTTPAI